MKMNKYSRCPQNENDKDDLFVTSGLKSRIVRLAIENSASSHVEN